MKIIDTLKHLCNQQNIILLDKGKGHFQIKGKLLVNYYPLSKRKSAYIAGTTGSVVNVSPKEAIVMSMTVPTCGARKDKRKKNSYRNIRKKLLNKFPYCHWCKKPLTLDTSTIEHIIPLVRGGMDNANNRTLACKKCNEERGSDMPELNQ